MLYFATGMVDVLIALVCCSHGSSRARPDSEHAQFERMVSSSSTALRFCNDIAMGASFQLVQVVMRTSLYSRAMGYVQFVPIYIRVCCYDYGLLDHMKLIVIGGLVSL